MYLSDFYLISKCNPLDSYVVLTPPKATLILVTKKPYQTLIKGKTFFLKYWEGKVVEVNILYTFVWLQLEMAKEKVTKKIQPY